MSNTKCTGLIGALLGHKFEPRYSSGLPVITPKSQAFSVAFADETVNLMDASKPKSYHHDVCVRCGLVINKQDETES